MKTQLIIFCLMISFLACGPSKQDDDSSVEDGFICPVLQENGAPQYTGIVVDVQGHRCVSRADGTKNCGFGPLQPATNNLDPNCFQFLDGAQVVNIQIQGPCFPRQEYNLVDISGDSERTYRPELIRAGAPEQCLEVESGEYWPDCNVPNQEVLDAVTSEAMQTALNRLDFCCEIANDADFNSFPCDD